MYNIICTEKNINVVNMCLNKAKQYTKYKKSNGIFKFKKIYIRNPRIQDNTRYTMLKPFKSIMSCVLN